MSRFFVKASRTKERISRLRNSLNPGDEFTVYYHDNDDNNINNGYPILQWQ